MTDNLRIDAEHPWPGLLPFTEDASDFFHGRDAEADELVRLIERETLTILFGQSGLGKSSLLNAGVFPRLRRASYLPVYLRLSLTDAPEQLSLQILQDLFATCKNSDVTASAIVPGDSFWEYLHRSATSFINLHGREVVPVFVFDQFEEIFTIGKETSRRNRQCQDLLKQLADLIENRMPVELEEKLKSQPERLDDLDLYRKTLKIVFSFREDSLADFEGLKTLIRPIMQNRMRLLPMNGENALNAVLQAGSILVNRDVSEKIVRFVGNFRNDAGTELGGLDVEPSLLSLVCRELNGQRINMGEATISPDLIKSETAQHIFEDFYFNCFTGLPTALRDFVEDRLLTAPGRRDSYALENALNLPGITEPDINELVNRRLLRREEQQGGRVRLELIHDVLLDVAKTSRDKRHEAEQERLALVKAEETSQAAFAAEAKKLAESRLMLEKQRKQQRLLIAAFVVMLIVMISITLLWKKAKRAEGDAVVKADKAAKAEAKAANQAKRAVIAEADAKIKADRAEKAEVKAANQAKIAQLAEIKAINEANNAKRALENYEHEKKISEKKGEENRKLQTERQAERELMDKEFGSERVAKALIPLTVKQKSVVAKSQENIANFKISDEMKIQHKDLIILITNTESMDTKEKQHWFDIMPVMTDEQVNRLFDILETERRKLEELEVKYQKEIAELNKEQYTNDFLNENITKFKKNRKETDRKKR